MKSLKQDNFDVHVSPLIRNQSITSVIFWFCTIQTAPLKVASLQHLEEEFESYIYL